MRAFDLNFARAARIFDQNFMRVGRKPVCPRGKILSGERVLRGDEILNGGEILSHRALNVGEILSGGGILRDCGISGGDGILNLTSRGGTQRGFCRRVLCKLCGETNPLHLRRKFQSASGSQADYKFKRATALQTDRKFKMAVSLRVAYKFKTPMQKFHSGYSAAIELLRQKSSCKIVPYNCLKFQNRPYALARLNFQGAMSKMGMGGSSAPLKFQISVAALLQLKFEGVPNAITRLKFQGAVAAVAEFARSKFRGLPQAAQFCKIRIQGQGG